MTKTKKNAIMTKTTVLEQLTRNARKNQIKYPSLSSRRTMVFVAKSRLTTLKEMMIYILTYHLLIPLLSSYMIRQPSRLMSCQQYSRKVNSIVSRGNCTDGDLLYRRRQEQEDQLIFLRKLHLLVQSMSILTFAKETMRQLAE